jgi:hypothetical protein
MDLIDPELDRDWEQDPNQDDDNRPEGMFEHNEQRLPFERPVPGTDVVIVKPDYVLRPRDPQLVNCQLWETVAPRTVSRNSICDDIKHMLIVLLCNELGYQEVPLVPVRTYQGHDHLLLAGALPDNALITNGLRRCVGISDRLRQANRISKEFFWTPSHESGFYFVLPASVADGQPNIDDSGDILWKPENGPVGCKSIRSRACGIVRRRKNGSLEPDENRLDNPVETTDDPSEDEPAEEVEPYDQFMNPKQIIARSVFHWPILEQMYQRMRITQTMEDAQVIDEHLHVTFNITAAHLETQKEAPSHAELVYRWPLNLVAGLLIPRPNLAEPAKAPQTPSREPTPPPRPFGGNDGDRYPGRRRRPVERFGFASQPVQNRRRPRDDGDGDNNHN